MINELGTFYNKVRFSMSRMSRMLSFLVTIRSVVMRGVLEVILDGGCYSESEAQVT